MRLVLRQTTTAGSGESSMRRITERKDPLVRTHILGHNPARSHSGSCCADGRALWVCKRALWVCNACFFWCPLLQWQRTKRHPLLAMLLSRPERHPLLAMLLSRPVRHPLLAMLVSRPERHPLLTMLFSRPESAVVPPP